MLAAVDQLNPYLTSLYQRDVRIGIGVHVGDVVVGAVGADDNNPTSSTDSTDYTDEVSAEHESAASVASVDR